MKDKFSMEEDFAQVLTASKAKDFANRLFKLRGPSVLEMITLKTGENLRWFPQWHPQYAEAEFRYAEIFEIYAPCDDNDEPHFKKSESEYIRLMRVLEEDSMAFWDSTGHPSAYSKSQRLSRSPRIFKDPALPLCA